MYNLKKIHIKSDVLDEVWTLLGQFLRDLLSTVSKQLFQNLQHMTKVVKISFVALN